MSYQILGRAVRNEYLALGTIISTAAIAFAATSGGSKDKAAKPASSLQESIQQAKASVPINAKSTEEEQLANSIKRFIEEEESKAKHH